MPKVKVDGIEVEVPQGATVLQACEVAGKEIPRFCYHERLSIAGNCRMCLVEMEKSPKPVASCAMPVADGQVIYTNTEMVKKARQGVMEFLLINHPLDCPICDQGGECDLQDQSMKYGVDKSRYELNKRSVKEKYMGPLIKTVMTRCIHCTRCIRFASEVAGVPDLGAINRGENMEVTTYLEKTIDSELSANVIDLCPVGALTSKPYAFEARPWELTKTESIDVMDAVGSNIRVDTKGWEVKRILPRLNDEINEEWISDKSRYACDGLLKNRLDTPFIKVDGKLKACSWDEAFKFILDNTKGFTGDKVFGAVGDLVDVESMYMFKKFFKDVLSSDNIDFRPTNYHIDTSLNARIRKAYLARKTKVYSIGDVGELTYPHENVGSSFSAIGEILAKNGKIYNSLKSAKKPVFIIGESGLSSNGEYVLESVKKILKENNFINNDWNGLNILHQNASSVGAIYLNLIKPNFLDKLNDDILKVVYLLGADQIKINTKNKFIIYQGSHGGLNSKIADVILPGAAYTEKQGLYVNTEGRVQNANKASFPPGDAKEDWKIFRALSEVYKKTIDINTHEILRENLFKDFPIFKDIDQLPSSSLETLTYKNITPINGNIKIADFDFYFSNIIAASSKTMDECKKAKQVLQKTGTDN
ncbi:MAG: NADH dehydrogenase (quinone) subunit G [Candidatus Fonsibacter ubiquis]|nr:NADH dehydrogenase (quinone) subunit G [Candidatus Fonsibacter ubiquis]